MTTPFNYSLSSFEINNVNNTEITEESESDIVDEDYFDQNHEDEFQSEYFPTDLDTSSFETDNDEVDPDAISVLPFFVRLRRNTQPNGSTTVDSDFEINENSTEEESKRITLNNETNNNVQDDNVDDHRECPICLSAWTNVGSHRLCALKCGHLFGYICIKHWLRSNNESSKKCPQCNSKASVKHIRFIYANKLTSIDNSELEAFKMKIYENKEKIKRISRALDKQKRKTRKYKEMYKHLKSSV